MISQFGKEISIQLPELRELVFQYLGKVDQPLNKVLLLPPDHTRLNSMAGKITAIVYEKLAGTGGEVDILPALGTHNPMTEAQLRMMFGDTIPLEVFKVHDWRNEVVCKGRIEGDVLSELSDGKLDYAVDVEVNKRLFEGYDLILSIGQVVPHEVVGMANYSKNIVVGVGDPVRARTRKAVRRRLVVVRDQERLVKFDLLRLDTQVALDDVAGLVSGLQEETVPKVIEAGVTDDLCSLGVVERDAAVVGLVDA